MMPTWDEVNHFNGLAIAKIMAFMDTHPDSEYMNVGIKKEHDRDYVCCVEHGTPIKCPTCGQIMSEGTMRGVNGSLGFPYWFCHTKECQSLLLARQERELWTYRNSGGVINRDSTILQHMNIPQSYHSKTMLNLKYAGKESIRTDMKNNTNMLISGDPGTGKTHMAVGLLIEFGRYNPHKFHFENLPDLFLRIQGCIKKDEDYTAIIDEAIKYDTLVLDDMGAGKITDYRREVLYNIISGRGFEEHQTIITTNMTMEQIRVDFDERLASRLSEYKLIHMIGKDHRRVK